jgi:peptide-methionine (S)-S-oxide reductase
MRRWTQVVFASGAVALAIVAVTAFRSTTSGDAYSDTSAIAAADMPHAPYVATSTAVFAGGCFWGVEAVFEHVRGVTSVVSGYAGGPVVNPDYDAVSGGRTGHAEAVRVQFDSSVVSYETLLLVFFTVAHDPTELNRQGPDVGTQYRSAIFAENAAQQAAATAFIARLTQAKMYPRPIVTQVSGPVKFYEAEAYHQNYLIGHMTQPYIVYNDLPKLDALKKRYPKLWMETPVK